MDFSAAHLTPGTVASVRFKEVVVYFSEEEWSQLDPWQRDLYSNVMRDIHTALLCLGYTILYPDVLCRIRRDREPCINSREEDQKGLCCPSTSRSVLSPDIVFRIKHDEEACTDEEGSEHGLPKSELGFPVEMSDLHKEGTSDGEKKEGQKDIPSTDDLTSETSDADQLVFNPKFSIWIKQVDEVSKVTPELLAPHTDEIDTKIKTEMDFTPNCNKSPSPQEFTETTSHVNTTPENHEVQAKIPMLQKDEHPAKGEESLLSIVLRRANAGSLSIPDYTYSSSVKDSNNSQSVPAITERDMRSQSKRSFYQTPNSNELLGSLRAHPPPLQHSAHQVDKPFRCRICAKGFKTLGILNVHMKTHSGVRPYQCSECGKSFRDNWNLKVHQKIHTGETPYRCSICDKGFIQYATYMKHQRIHTGEKPYSCCYCDKSFTNSSNLVRHYRTHTGEKPYVCMECGKSFSYNTSLIQHKRSHKVETAGINDPNNT